MEVLKSCCLDLLNQISQDNLFFMAELVKIYEENPNPKEIKKVVDLPIIALYKQDYDDSSI